MNQYLTTYSHDFVWPYIKKTALPTAGRSAESPYDEKHRCTCGAEPGGYLPPREYVDTPVTVNYQWNRLEPMGPLLDPKLYPTKMGPGPEFETTQHDQPNTYLKKLQEKYPYLYNILQSSASDDMMRRVNEDRLRTTYQMDYGHIDEYPSADYDQLLAEAGLSSDCSKTTGMDARVHIKPSNYSDQNQAQDRTNNSGGFAAFGNKSGEFEGSREVRESKGVSNDGSARGARNLAVKAMKSSGGGTGKKDEGGFGSPEGEKGKRAGKIVDESETSNKPLPAWISEYQEIIGQTGLDIVRDRIHQHGGRSPGRIFMDRAIVQCRTHS